VDARRVVAFGVAAVSATLAQLGRIEPVRVHAAALQASDDADGDGLPDALELKLGTEIDLVDSDADGFSDSEEVARGSIPTRGTSVPGNEQVALSIDAYKQHDKIHALTALYFADGDLRSRVFTVGLLNGDALAPVPIQDFRGTRPIVVLPGSTPGSRVVMIDPVLPSSSMQLTGSLSFWATLASQGHYVAADAVNLTLVNGDIYEHVFVGYHTGLPDPQPNVGMGVGGVYQPLGAGSSQSSATQGEICAQTTVIVGMVGSVITQEVVAAHCVPGWDAYCSSACPQTVGSTIKVIDPATLLGG
jgi:hypothetical protein